MSVDTLKPAVQKAPPADRPHIPNYGIPRSSKGMLPWSRVERALRDAPRYWIATTDDDGRPHLIQQWGAFVGGRYYLEGGRHTRWARNLARDGRVAVSVERGTLSIMLEGRARAVRPKAALAREIIDSYAAKPYEYTPVTKNWTGAGALWEVSPERIFAWSYKSFTTTATRFHFAQEEA